MATVEQGPMSKRYRIGIDVGGTFTDFVLYDQDAALTVTRKAPTTPHDPSIGILAGLAALGISLKDVDGIAHGTTTATNSLIERNGAKTAFLTTEGFRDTLEIRRANRQELYDAQWVPPLPLVRRRDRLEIKERLYWDGEVALPLDEAQVGDVIETLLARDVEAVAICFVHAYQHPVHEHRVKTLVQAALPQAFVTASHEVSQELREFERGSTTAANAFVGPKVQTYLRHLRQGLQEAGLNADVAIMQSNGGVCTTEEAGRLPVKLARSGPAGGAMALQQISELTAVPDLVGIDIGGTSADVCVIVGGRPRWTSPLVVEWGLPLLMPSVDVVSIGAGGGALAWIDDGEVLHMGPQSAGAVPGPACYGRGGGHPTSTDAQVVLGRVAAGTALGGEITIDRDLAEEAVRVGVAEPLGLSIPDAADGMLKILDNAMLQAIRLVTVEKGYDPRGFALVGFGGGGPMHVVSLARELGMRRAIVPMNPGVLSAWGMLTVDMVQDRSRTVLRRLSVIDVGELTAVFGAMAADISASFERQGVDAAGVIFEYVLDMQYYGQVYSLPVGLGGPAPGDDDVRVSEEGVLPITVATAKHLEPFEVTATLLEQACETFHVEHEREYGHSDRGQELQIVHARVFGRAAIGKPQLGLLEGELATDDEPRWTSVRTVLFEGTEEPTRVYAREALHPGHRLVGPAIVEEPSSTTVLPPKASLVIDAFGNLLINTNI